MGGIVLTAGRSARMGEPKALLDLDGRTFVAAAVDALREGGCDEIVVVLGDPAVREAVRGLRVRVVWNRAAESEQLDSMLAGLDGLPASVVAAVMLPVDHPLVLPETVRALLDAGRRNPDAVIRPTLNGEPGHPTLFPREVWDRLDDPTLPLGARSVVESPATRTMDV